MAPVLPRGVTTELISRIAAISTSIFPGPLSFEVANHPENPSYEYVVFDVVARGDYGDYRDRIFAWHDEVDRIAPDNGGMFRLIVHPQP